MPRLTCIVDKTGQMHLQDKISQLRLVRCDESGDKFSWVNVIRIMPQFNEEHVRVLDLVVEGSLVQYSLESLHCVIQKDTI